MDSEEIRLQKFLANAGVTSRRKAEELILQGKVRVNGRTIKELGTKVNPNKDVIEFDGQTIKNKNKKIYILLNKPIGYVTTLEDQFNRDKVTDLINGVSERLVPAGRLDMYTSGALILSNDGDFINKITHPKNEISKTYNVTLKGIVTKEEINKLESGIEISLEKKDYSNLKNGTNKRENINRADYNEFVTNKKKDIDRINSKNLITNQEDKYITRPAKVKILKTDKEKNISRLQITIKEGKNREVRKMCEAIGKKVLALHRAKIGDINVRDLPLGKWRYLKKEEIDSLLKEQ